MPEIELEIQAPLRKYYPALDGVRAVAAILVILFHLAQMGVPIIGPSAFGETGVDLFFVLSGFLITRILLKMRQHDWKDLRSFYIRRTLRIFPLYYGYLVAALALKAIVSWWYWVYLQNITIALGAPMGSFGHFWSLAVEEQFYLVWPFLVVFLPRRRLQVTLWCMLVLTLLCRLVLVENTHILVYYLTITRLDGLAGGALLALYEVRGVLPRLRRQMFSLAAISFAMMVWLGIRYHGAGLPVVQVTKFSFIACFYTSIVGLLLTQRSNRGTDWLASRPMRFIGRISYGLYVFHPQMLRICFALLAGHSIWLMATSGLAATLAVTLISWYSFEKPILRLKDRLAHQTA